MPRVAMPDWLERIEQAYLPCEVIEREPSGATVVIKLNGHSVTAVVPHDSLATSPDGREAVLRVNVLADLPPSDPFGPGRLVELPSQPLSETQRVRIKADWLTQPEWLSQT